MAEEENVKVAVRVRPFNKREIDRGSKLCVQMNGKITTVTNPATNQAKPYTYDYSYWSFDGGKELKDGYMQPDSSHPNGNKYCDQKRAFNDLGQGIIKNAWAGYNATLFAYGQTGSGKSWSVIGYGANKGIVPMLCEELFQGIKNNKEDKQFEVGFSMLEIYNEVARDLLSSSQSKNGLKIRQHPKKGFYVENLRKVLVTSHEEIATKMEEGTVSRTIRSTNMNATSSRAHTIVTITFIQKFKNPGGQETAKTAIINLVDLAGSERVESTGATGERLKEGAAINLSLTCLGNCINALVKQGQGQAGVRVPFRDSTLTKLLKNALGGNSKTVMVAAISPADINYEETVSTLNFADRAKQIKTKAVVNEDPTEKLIRELKEENDKLRKMMQTGKIDANFVDEDGDGIDDRDNEKIRKKLEEEMRARMLENEKEMNNMKKSYEDKLKMAKREVDPSIKLNEEEKQKKPHIYNLNADPQLTGKIFHILKAGTTSVGNRKGQESDITVIGPSIQPQHATFTVAKNWSVTLKPQSNDCRVLHNGGAILESKPLQHNDRIVFGSTQIWVFQNPIEKNKSKQKYQDITYEFAQEEIAAKSGLDMNTLSSGTDVAGLQSELLEVMPAIDEANSISEELDKKVKFELVLVSPQMLGKTSGKTEIHVKMRNLGNGTEFDFTKEKFLSRLYMMKEMYAKYEEEEEEWDVPHEKDPFHESLDTEIHIGTVQVIMQPVAHLVELKEQLEITNRKGAEVGVMNVEVVPCNKSGKEYTEKDDVFVDSPENLIGGEIFFKFKIINCLGLPNRYSDIYCSYTQYLGKEEIKTKKISDTINPSFNHVKMFQYRPVTKQFIDYLMTGSVVIKVMGKQRVRKSAVPLNNGLTTKDMLKNDRTVFAKTATLMNGFQMNGRVVDPQRQSIIVELLLMKKTQARLQQRVDNIVKLIKEADNVSRPRVSVTLLREVMNAAGPEQADAIIRKKLSAESDNIKDATSSSLTSSVCTLL